MIFRPRWLVMCLALMLIAPLAAPNCQPTTADERPYRDSATARLGYDRLVALYDDYERRHGGWVTTPNGRMHYLRWGNRNATTFVWLPGTFGTAYGMYRFADSLVAMGLQVIAVDYYGHGQTPIPAHEVSVYDAADDVAALLDSLRVRKAIISGFSRGGMIAAAVYQSHRPRVAGLVLIDGGSFALGRIYANETDEGIKRLFGTPPPCGLLACEEGFTDRFDLFWRLFRDRRPAALRDEFLLPHLASMRRGDDGKWRIRPGLRAWLWEDTFERIVAHIRRPWDGPLFQRSTYNIEPQVSLRRLDVPVLIIDPVRDDEFIRATPENEALQRRYPALVTHLIYPNTSHDVMYERPEWFLRDVRQFIARVRGTGSFRR